MDKVTTTTSVFEAIDPVRAPELEFRAQLLSRLQKLIDGMNQKEAAGALGVDQPRISDIRRGKLSRFSADKLVELLARMGQKTEARFPKPMSRARRAEEMDPKAVLRAQSQRARTARTSVRKAARG